SRDIKHDPRNPKKQGLRECFAIDDLYTHWFNDLPSVEMEKIFFGKIDSYGLKVVDTLCNFSHIKDDPGWWPLSWNEQYTLYNLLIYMTTQKLRTPKGIDWLTSQISGTDKNNILMAIAKYRQLFHAVWTECVWQIADAKMSDTKFIVSDHPITVYSRYIGPRNKLCRGSNDPDIRINSVHTIFPLSLEKVLILTNTSWARNPYSNSLEMRPNPVFNRPAALFPIEHIQTMRSLSEQEVREINFVIKSRAYKYIAAGKEDWLYPEKYVSKSDWNTFGGGLLLMPDPRSMSYTTGFFAGWDDGRRVALDEYGRTHISPDYDKREHGGFAAFQRIQGDFAKIFGPKRRGRACSFPGDLDPEKDSDDMHESRLKSASKKDFR
ncbi:MAG: DUF4238 domain-containing protein, partial [Candidatus Nomurabacteria bacterium]|nr:DUF4238 domain-containing protein [Candidatus Nomurabacteria bacterium]